MVRSTSHEHLPMGNLFSGRQTNESRAGPRESPFAHNSHRFRRRAVTEAYPVSPGYHNAFPNASTSAIPMSPPAYEDSDKLPPSRFKILPREEEGREELPQYTCSLHKEDMLERKMELRNPFERAHKRRWKKCYMVLHGTKLDIHKPKKTHFLTGTKNEGSFRPTDWQPGTLLGSYTLQLAQVGTATDYKKRTFVIRLRVQTEQFLLSCRTLESFLEWLEVLSAAVDLSPPLEERSLPRYQTLPRRRRRRVVHAPVEGIGPETVQEQLDIIRQNFPHLQDESAGADGAGIEGEDLTQESISGLSDILAPGIHPAFRITPRRASEPEETFDRDGKWAPRNAISREANMRLARRCVAELFADAPRQSDCVVVKGKRFRLLYESKEMVPDIESDFGARRNGLRSGAAKTKGKGKMKESADDVKLPRLPEYEEAVENQQRDAIRATC